MTVKNLSRRKLLTDAVKVVTGTALGAGIFGLASGSGVKGRAQGVPDVPWPYVKLDPVAVAERAYAGFYAEKRLCMYGVFEGIIGELREKVGFPYTMLPTKMMEYGKGGVNTIWGTLCGTLNASAAVINLVSKAPGPLIDEVFFWACQKELPDYKPKSPKFEIVKSVSGSPICHISVQKWCEVAKFKPVSPQRSERCAWLTASVAKYTVEQLNKEADGVFKPVHVLPDDVKKCMACHGKGAREDVHHGGHMLCTQCHVEGWKHPPKK